MMSTDGLPRILCVDDDPALLEGLSRILRSHYKFESAPDGKTALERINATKDFAVVVSDQRMPVMDGVTLLSHVRSLAPHAVRVLLTGQADMASAIAAVNQGNIFRFLTKPCSSPDLLKALTECVEQHRLIVAEKTLLEETLSGSIRALVEVMSISNPAAFARATRVRQSVEHLLVHFDIRERWPIEVAAMLSQLGLAVLPDSTLEKFNNGVPMTLAEQAMLDRMPTFVDRCLSNIPRLQPVRDILRLYPRKFDQLNSSPDGNSFPWGARALKIVIDFDCLESGANPSEYPISVMQSRMGWYDPIILDAFAKHHQQAANVEMAELQMQDIEIGMFFAEDLRSPNGILLVARGQEVTSGLLQRLRNLSSKDIAGRRVFRVIANNAVRDGAARVSVPLK
jgi:response regulator RpfG family c-di-GMP phosphodiesterase